MESFLQDLRYSLRQLTRNLGFAVTAVISLALGVGATVAVFSTIYGVLLHPFPYADIDRLCNLSVRQPAGDISDQVFTGAQLEELRKVHGFESIASWRLERLTITGGELPEPAAGYFGIGETFPTFGVSALLGRNLGPSDSPDGQEPQPVVELHYRFWRRHFHGDPNIVGRTLEIDHKQYTIVGVTRSNFTAGWGTDLYLPQAIGNPAGGGVIVKLRRGVGLAAADAELQPLLEQFAHEDPRLYPRGFRVDIRTLSWETTHNIGPILYLLFCAVALLLVIGCSNVSILLLARNTARQHEFAVRSAVGARGGRIVRQLLTESLLLAVTGTGIGIVLAYRLLALIVAWLPRHLFPPDVSIRINTPVLLFSAGLALATALFFGLAPALQLAKAELGAVLQSGAKRVAGTVAGRRLHRTLVVAQIALTLLLLTAAGASIQGFLRLLRVPLGYTPRGVIAAGFPLRQNSGNTWQARLNNYDQLRTEVAQLPVVTAMAVGTYSLPPYAGWEQPFAILGRSPMAPEAQTARINFVDSGYFRTLEIPLLSGRLWTTAEVAHGASFVLVNQTLARQYMPDGNILGRVLTILGLNSDPSECLTPPGNNGAVQVVGLVADSVNNGINQPIQPAIYAPFSVRLCPGVQMLVRVRGAPDAAANSIRGQMAKLHPDQMVLMEDGDLETWLRDEPVWSQGRLVATLFTGFSIMALVLSAVGLYSVVAYAVAQRTNEFGIRMALGAPRAHVLRVVMASVAGSVGFGIGAGLALSFGLHRVLAGWVGETGSSGLIVAGVSVLLLIVAALACLVPVRRALAVDPMMALRCE